MFTDVAPFPTRGQAPRRAGSASAPLCGRGGPAFDQRGFTLVELVVTVAIIAILATIALASYQSYIRSSRRAEAQSFLMNVATRQQQFLLDTRAFASTVAGTGLTVPPSVAERYTLSLVLGDAAAPNYRLSATPIGAQAAEPCGTLSIDNNGIRLPASGGCW